MILYITIGVLSLALGIIITRLVFEIPKFSKRADDTVDLQRVSAELLKRQNDILTLLMHSEFDGKKIALINKATSSVKTIDISELKDYDLSLYDVQVLKK